MRALRCAQYTSFFCGRPIAHARAATIIAVLIIAACAAVMSATNAQGRKATWTYTTMFDGKDMPVSGDTRTETTSVKKIGDRTNEITNERGGKVTQVIINVLSADGKRIDNTYKNYSESGDLTSTAAAVYERLP